MAALHVAVAVILDSQERILISKRSAQAHQGGLWEFPGGKVEAGESVEHALARELQEEVGIGVGSVTPLLKVRHRYSDKDVLLDVWVVRDFSGTARGCEGQPLAWISVEGLQDYSFPEANKPIIEAVDKLLNPH
ncbi:MAG: 8-oxo-dGTP diphosphatase MutT [Halioglobus sp.]